VVWIADFRGLKDPDSDREVLICIEGIQSLITRTNLIRFVEAQKVVAKLVRVHFNKGPLAQMTL
jgi:hypothetical protein